MKSNSLIRIRHDYSSCKGGSVGTSSAAQPELLLHPQLPCLFIPRESRNNQQPVKTQADNTL